VFGNDSLTSADRLPDDDHDRVIKRALLQP